MDTPSSCAPTDTGTPADITTFVVDPLRDKVLLRLTGAVALPVGSMIELPDGSIARVSALRLNASNAKDPTLLVQVTRSRQPSQIQTCQRSSFVRQGRAAPASWRPTEAGQHAVSCPPGTLYHQATSPVFRSPSFGS